MSKNGKLKRLKNLPQNQGKSDQELQDLVKSKEIDTDLDLLSKFTDKEEKRVAKGLLRQYLTDFTIENVSDRNNLAQVIYLEVNQLRIQEKLNEMYAKDAKAIPGELLEIMNRNSDVLIKLKNTLGLSKSKEKLSAYDSLQHLMERHRKWEVENQASRHIKCPHCLQMIWLKIRTDAWEALKHPFFKDTFIYNKPLLENYGKTLTLDRDFIASVFGVSSDYIDWIFSKLVVKKLTGDSDTNTGAPDGQKETSRQEEEKVISQEQVIQGQVNGRTDTESIISVENGNPS